MYLLWELNIIIHTQNNSMYILQKKTVTVTKRIVYSFWTLIPTIPRFMKHMLAKLQFTAFDYGSWFIQIKWKVATAFLVCLDSHEFSKTQECDFKCITITLHICDLHPKKKNSCCKQSDGYNSTEKTFRNTVVYESIWPKLKEQIKVHSILYGFLCKQESVIGMWYVHITVTQISIWLVVHSFKLITFNLLINFWTVLPLSCFCPFPIFLSTLSVQGLNRF